MKKPIFLPIIVFMISSCLIAQVDSDYNPISVGNYWIQHSDSGSGWTSRTDIEGTDLIGDIEYFRMKQVVTIDDGSEEPIIMYVWNGQGSAGGLLGAFGETSDIDSAVIYDPPVLSSPAEATTVGYTWEYDMPGTGDGGQHFACILESLSETVEVPTGIYNDCIKISYIVSDMSGEISQTFDLYYAEGVGQVLNEGWSTFWNNYRFELIEYHVQSIVGVEKSPNVPILFSLHQNYPNPFNPTTTINYSLQISTNVSVIIYNTLGQEVKVLVDEFQNSGYKSVIWDGTNNAGLKIGSGTYFYKLTAGNFVSSKKMILLK